MEELITKAKKDSRPGVQGIINAIKSLSKQTIIRRYNIDKDDLLDILEDILEDKKIEEREYYKGLVKKISPSNRQKTAKLFLDANLINKKDYVSLRPLKTPEYSPPSRQDALDKAVEYLQDENEIDYLAQNINYSKTKQLLQNSIEEDQFEPLKGVECSTSKGLVENSINNPNLKEYIRAVRMDRNLKQIIDDDLNTLIEPNKKVYIYAHFKYMDNDKRYIRLKYNGFDENNRNTDKLLSQIKENHYNVILYYERNNNKLETIEDAKKDYQKKYGRNMPKDKLLKVKQKIQLKRDGLVEDLLLRRNDDRIYWLFLKYVVINKNFNIQPFDYLKTNINYNCLLNIIKDNLAHKNHKHYDKRIKLIDEYNEKYFDQGITPDVLKIILNKLNDINVRVFYPDLNKPVFLHTTKSTNKIINILAQNHHATILPDIKDNSYNEYLLKNKNKTIHVITTPDEIYKKEGLFIENEYLTVITETHTYKTYQPKYDQNAISPNSDIRTLFKKYKGNGQINVRRPTIYPLNFQYLGEKYLLEKGIRQNIKRIDKINSYRSSIHTLQKKQEGYPMLYLPPIKSNNPRSIIEKYEGEAYIIDIEATGFDKYIFQEKNYLYPFNLIRYAYKQGIKFTVQFMYVSLNRTLDIYPEEFLQNTKESNNEFCILNGSLCVKTEDKTITTTDENTFFNHLVNFNDNIVDIQIIEDFDKTYKIKYKEEKKYTTGRSDIYNYNLAETRICILEKIKELTNNNCRILAVRTDSITYQGKYTPKVVTEEKYKDKTFYGEYQIEDVKNLYEFPYDTYTKYEGIELQENAIESDIIEKLHEDLFIVGFAGAGKSYTIKNDNLLKLFPCYPTLKSLGTTIQTYSKYAPKNKVWDFQIKNIKHEHAVIIIDECFRLTNKFIEGFKAIHPYTRLIYVGDPYQIIREDSIRQNDNFIDLGFKNQRFKDDPAFYEIIKYLAMYIKNNEPHQKFYEIETKKPNPNLVAMNENFMQFWETFAKTHNIKTNRFHIGEMYTNTNQQADDMLGTTIDSIQGITKNEPFTIVINNMKNIRSLYVAVTRATKLSLINFYLKTPPHTF